MCFKTPVIKTGMPGVALKPCASYHVCIFSFHDGPPWKYHWWHSTNVCVHLIPVTHKVINRPVSGAPSSEGKQKEAANSCFSKCGPKASCTGTTSAADSWAPLHLSCTKVYRLTLRFSCCSRFQDNAVRLWQCILHWPSSPIQSQIWPPLKIIQEQNSLPEVL